MCCEGHKVRNTCISYIWLAVVMTPGNRLLLSGYHRGDRERQDILWQCQTKAERRLWRRRLNWVQDRLFINTSSVHFTSLPSKLESLNLFFIFFYWPCSCEMFSFNCKHSNCSILLICHNEDDIIRFAFFPHL